MSFYRAVGFLYSNTDVLAVGGEGPARGDSCGTKVDGDIVHDAGVKDRNQSGFWRGNKLTPELDAGGRRVQLVVFRVECRGIKNDTILFNALLGHKILDRGSDALKGLIIEYDVRGNLLPD